LTTVVVWCLGLSAVFSFNLWSDFTPLDMVPALEGRTVFSILDYVVSNFFLPLNALLIALMAGWAIDRGRLRSDIGLEPGTGWRLFLLSVRYLAPLAVSSTFLFNLAG
jgi:NSS family neurotransmitter:Na+ symporter